MLKAEQIICGANIKRNTTSDTGKITKIYFHQWAQSLCFNVKWTKENVEVSYFLHDRNDMSLITDVHTVSNTLFIKESAIIQKAIIDFCKNNNISAEVGISGSIRTESESFTQIFFKNQDDLYKVKKNVLKMDSEEFVFFVPDEHIQRFEAYEDAETFCLNNHIPISYITKVILSKGLKQEELEALYS